MTAVQTLQEPWAQSVEHAAHRATQTTMSDALFWLRGLLRVLTLLLAHATPQDVGQFAKTMIYASPADIFHSAQGSRTVWGRVCPVMLLSLPGLLRRGGPRSAICIY